MLFVDIQPIQSHKIDHTGQFLPIQFFQNHCSDLVIFNHLIKQPIAGSNVNGNVHIFFAFKIFDHRAVTPFNYFGIFATSS